MSVPFIPEDEDGSLTSEIITSLETSGVVTVVPRHADYRLQVTILSRQNDPIGYRRNPQKIGGEVKTNLLTAERRNALQVEVNVFRGGSDELVFGPYLLTADADYDFVDGDSYQDLTFTSSKGDLVEVLPFSLGQLESLESAREASCKPVYRKLAQKIVDVISSEW